MDFHFSSLNFFRLLSEKSIKVHEFYFTVIGDKATDQTDNKEIGRSKKECLKAITNHENDKFC